MVVLYSQNYAAGDTQALRTTTNNEERRPPAGGIFMENRVCLGPYTETLPKPEAAHEKSLAPRVMNLWNTSLDTVNKRESFVEKANNCHSSIKFMAEMSATAKLAERCTGIAWYKPEFFSGFLFATAKVAYDCDDHPSFKEITFLDTKVYRGVRFNNDNK